MSAADVLPHAIQEYPEELQPFNWAKQWYPMAYIQDLDTKVPHPVELLSQRLVLWCDGQGQWRCFQDKCPHRLAPLSGRHPPQYSDGRLTDAGTAMLAYLGPPLQEPQVGVVLLTVAHLQETNLGFHVICRGSH